MMIDAALALLPTQMDSPEARVMLRAPDAKSSNGTPLYKTACPDCGTVRLGDKRRMGKPCAPCSSKRRSTHGLCGHPLYRLLLNMRARCEYPSATNYSYYGGRGVKVCDEWRGDPAAFVTWAESNGYQPGLEIDRKDNNGPYAPWNCQFIAHATNSQKRRNVQCTMALAANIKKSLSDGLTVAEASDAAGVPYMVAWHISNGNTWRAA